MKMTDEQRKLVENNHSLIYGYLNKKGLESDEFYDLAAIGLCNAAMTYDSSKGVFSTYAFACIDREVMNHCVYMNRKKIIPSDMILSYDISADEDFKESCIDTLIDDEFDEIEYSTENMAFEDFITTLKDREILIIKYLKDGLTQQEIAKELNRSQQAVFLNIKNIREKWNIYSNR